MTTEVVAMMSFPDKTWGGYVHDLEGPWQHEPDKVQWLAHDLDCLAVRNHFGAWCGYVGLPPGHPWYGVEYGEIPYEDVDVHGGLTFSDFCAPGEPVTGICHTPLPGRPAKVWWVGFDCGHATDLQPAFERRMEELESHVPGLSDSRKRLKDAEAAVPEWAKTTYKPAGYVMEETTRLAEQLAGQATRQV